MSRGKQLLAVVLAVAVGLAWAAPAGAAESKLQPGVSRSTGGPSDEAIELAKQLEARFVDTVVSNVGDLTIVTFTDLDGTQYRYEFPRTGDQPGSPPGTIAPQYAWTWNGWELNRAETRQLWLDGATAAVIYAIGAAFGCTACVVGAAIEGYWSTQAYAMYSNGNCIKIYYWLAVTEHSGSNCY